MHETHNANEEEFLTTVSHCWIGFNVQLKSHPNIEQRANFLIADAIKSTKWADAISIFPLLNKKRSTANKGKPFFFVRFFLFLFFSFLRLVNEEKVLSLLDWMANDRNGEGSTQIDPIVCSNVTNINAMNEKKRRKKIYHRFILNGFNFIWID